MLPTNLHRFARFPPELRCSIWRFALGEPHVHRLRIGPGQGESQNQDQDQDQSLVLYPAETLPSSTATTRTILSTYMESRIEAIRALPDSLPLFSPSPNAAGGCYTLRFNARKDVICLAELEPDAVGAVRTLLRDPPPNRKKDDSQWLKQLGSVKRLAIDVRNISFVYDYRELGRRREELAVLPSFLAAFAGLEWLFLIPWPSRDERATLVCDPNPPHEEQEEQREGVDQMEGEDEVVEAEDGNLQPQDAEAVS
ncbi:hypothetical protein UCRPA7_7257 [Phaeoacremonium minimum UCRPA7]|uniref:2EXR domain-containing protein n=1 Tax=Phaeoacremonium minimum (strain UCR-PA7) TaxID=1286976 RepID=R8BD60_PHAM7|nr:hypothetical protein UCRPA7_7257 [Phaeoacremonium minimum UCRPA7]EON97230.1 hypothetical protein UCRPA7_7257 [Phaeoacremonium minimum UCRPA7]